MGKSPAKRGKSTERRSHPRSNRKATKAATPAATHSSISSTKKSTATKHKAPAAVFAQDQCSFCEKSLKSEERVLFVEEDLGKVFCSEGCITSFFAPEIEKLEREYFRQLSPEDLSGTEREKLAHLRWITLEQPDEVWREKTISGFNRYTLISEFRPGPNRVWCVCICLFLRGEPSFLYLAFTTKNAAMVDAYRRGEQIPPSALKTDGDEKKRPAKMDKSESQLDNEAQQNFNESSLDRLAESWTEDETVLSQNQRSRSKADIQPDEYGTYQSFLEQTLENPEELWNSESKRIKTDGPEALRIFHFIRFFPKHEKGPFWYVIIARELMESEQESEGGKSSGDAMQDHLEEDSQQMEILEAFPTRDPDIVQQYRIGQNELSAEDEDARATGTSRVVH